MRANRNHAMVRVMRCLAAVFLCLATLSEAVVAPNQHWMIYGLKHSELHRSLVQALEKASIDVERGKDPAQSETCDGILSAKRVVLLGASTASKAMACLHGAPNQAQLSATWVIADIPLAAWYRIAPKKPPPAINMVVLTIDQPLERQLALAERLFPGPERVAVLSSHAMAPWSQANEGFLKDSPYQVQTIFLRPDSLAPTFIAAARRHDLLILPVEPLLFNAATARTLLLAAYRQRRPLIGNTQAFVRAGVLASCVTSDAILLADLLAILKAPPQNPSVAVRMPSDFDVLINKQVALAFGIGTKDPYVLKRAIQLRLNGRDNP